MTDPSREASVNDPATLEKLARDIRQWSRELGFTGVGIADVDLSSDEPRLLDWLRAGRHGDMEWMERHGTLRSRPQELVPGSVRVIAVRLDYFPPGRDPWGVLSRPELGYVSRYALGRDYHKLMRRRLQKLAERIRAASGSVGYRAFVDSAPVLEKALARKAGLGWVGKHTNVLSRDAGSWFFLGELFTDLPLPTDAPVEDHCGSCRKCIDVCPTGAITGPRQLDARRCISYLTIEHRGSIPEPLRPAIGNRIYGCDDCQLVCPWNRYAHPTAEADFAPRNGLDAPALSGLLGWSEQEFLQRTEGSAIRRIGHQRWLRNVAVALGNAPPSAAAATVLSARADHPSAMVREHVAWALRRQRGG
ncbi:MAG TPA: tRNA epoxyqueuosine(34) reductase QueG [Gammaproteobacteria bacterium]|nr:tRNA epoxyqueuosine(34) reductase QueG [Gammaproteobacteria bacterium]